LLHGSLQDSLHKAARTGRTGKSCEEGRVASYAAKRSAGTPSKAIKKTPVSGCDIRRLSTYRHSRKRCPLNILDSDEFAAGKYHKRFRQSAEHYAALYDERK
jgi:hypothetical protein